MRNEVQDIYDTLSPELRLLLVCLSSQINQKKCDVIDTLLAMPLNWNHFIYLAVFHGVYPQVYQFLSKSEYADLPREVISILREKCRENTSKTLQMTGELVKVLRTIEENGIQAVVLKGFPLAHQLYGNMGIRPSRDIDLLVQPEDVDKVREIIETQGYNRIYPSFAATPKWPQKWMQRKHHFEYWHRKKNICIELHWKLGHHGMEIPLTNIESKLTQVKIAGQSMYMLGMEELLVYLVLHGASHRWFRLKWLCDIGMMLKQEGFSWERLYSLTEQLGVKPIINQTLILSRKLLDAPIPENIMEMAASDIKAPKLAALALPFIIVSELANQKNSMLACYREKRYEFFMQCGWRRKITYIHTHFSPTDTDFEYITLPDKLYFLYYLIRPWTWFSRRLSELSSK